jgi:hypothetical protein
MLPSMSDVSRLVTYRDEAIAAMLAGDYDTALKNAYAALAILATTPDMSRSSGSGGGQQSATWSRDAVEKFISRLESLRGRNLGLQSSNVTYQEVVDTDAVY